MKGKQTHALIQWVEYLSKGMDELYFGDLMGSRAL